MRIIYEKHSYIDIPLISRYAVVFCIIGSRRCYTKYVENEIEYNNPNVNGIVVENNYSVFVF